jgi:hypothetical protein
MERKRIDLAGSKAARGTASTRPDRRENPLSNPKNIVMLSIAGAAILGAGYLFYSNFFSTGSAPQESSTPQVDAIFQEAKEAPPPPPPDSNVQFEPGGGKRLSN